MKRSFNVDHSIDKNKKSKVEETRNRKRKLILDNCRSRMIEDKRRFQIIEDERRFQIIEDECRDKIMSDDDFLENPKLKQQKIVSIYKCIIHNDDKAICGIYDCCGMKFRELSFKDSQGQALTKLPNYIT